MSDDFELPSVASEHGAPFGTGTLAERLRALVPHCEDPSDYTEDDRIILEAAERLSPARAAGDAKESTTHDQ